MPSPYTDNLLDHEVDGIHEFDNPIPGWWNWLFVATIVFSVLYYWFWHTSIDAWTNEEAWQHEQVVAFRRVFGQIGELKPDEATILKMAGDKQMMAVARSIFIGNCAACHAKDGGGLTGVNLTDDQFKNVRVVEDLYTTITKGANNGAMPAWENRLLSNERIILAAFVASLRGTHPATPKAPEGNSIPPWPSSAPAN